jgi:hypothetical protein
MTSFRFVGSTLGLRNQQYGKPLVSQVIDFQENSVVFNTESQDVFIRRARQPRIKNRKNIVALGPELPRVHG